MSSPWAAGDYARVADVLWPAAEEAAAAVSRGDRVLDVAAGTGNLAIAAARRGARVTASDITPALIEQGRHRCGQEGLDVEWVEADALALPFEDGSFDVVGSVFGAIFAPDPERAAAEMFRVVRTGGRVVLTAWVPEGWNGAFMRIVGEASGLPPGVAPPPEWGIEPILRDRLAPHADALEVARGEIAWPGTTPDELLAFLEESAPPLAAPRAALPPERYARLRDDLRAAFAAEASWRPGAPYLCATATKALH